MECIRDSGCPLFEIKDRDDGLGLIGGNLANSMRIQVMSSISRRE